MDDPKLDGAGEFVARQYAHLVAHGLDDASARQRLREVLGEAATGALDGSPSASSLRGDRDGTSRRVLDRVRQLGGDTARAQAVLIQAGDQARLLALGWWRPVRSFLLYVLFLVALAAVIATIYLLLVLPAFSQLDQTIGAGEGGFGARSVPRALAPVLLMVAGLAWLAARWRRDYRRMARFEPLAGATSKPGTDTMQVLRCVEVAAAIQASGVADAAVLPTTLDVAGWPSGQPLVAFGEAIGERLAQAERLGTLAAELDWQRRVQWSAAQARLDLSRDRLMLAARVLFYILIGSMVTMLYLPIFSVASMIGVH
jgi:hypothetical protein